MMVVLVLMINCHVSENPKNGPVIPHKTMIVTAEIKVHGDPASSELLWANFRKNLRIVSFSLMLWSFLAFE